MIQVHTSMSHPPLFCVSLVQNKTKKRTLLHFINQHSQVCSSLLRIFHHLKSLESHQGEQKDMESVASSSTANQKKVVTLKTADGHEFVIDHEVAKQSNTLNLMIDVDCTNSVIPLSNITGNVMAVIVDFCKKSLDFQLTDAAVDGKMKAWEAEFINNVDSSLIYDLILVILPLPILSSLLSCCQYKLYDACCIYYLRLVFFLFLFGFNSYL